MERPSLEICAETLQQCIAAREGGADRIELCSALVEGGLTPSHGLIRAAVAESNLPIYVMLRPRGGDFVYSDTEFDVMLADLDHAIELGASGIVCGLLRRDNTVDVARTTQIVRRAGPLPVTFHRAFDETADFARAVEEVIACGCQSVLTSGGKPSVGDAESTVEDLAAQAAGRIRIMAGGGVTLAVAESLLSRVRVDLHTSLRRRLVSGGAASGNLAEQISDVRALAGLVAAAR